MTDLMNALDGWSWIIVGLLLMMLEAVAPGVFLVWFGGAAIATGLVSLIFDLSLTGEALTFAILAVASLALGWRYGNYASGESDRPLLNIRGKQYVGRSFTLDEPIDNGHGRVKVGDTTWRVTGPDAAAGTTVRVTGVEGTTLVVETES